VIRGSSVKSPRRAIHEITRINTNDCQLKITNVPA
jgi:hypothetical protein